MKNNTFKSIRLLMFIGFLLTVAMMGTAFFFQYVLYLDPCPLCSAQRGVVIVMGIIFLIAFLQGPKTWGKNIYGLLLTLASLTGLLIAGRHTWLQHLPPDKVPECGPGLDYWMDHLPAVEIIQNIFKGSGECAQVVWTFLGFSIPEWSIVAFLFFLFFSVKLLIKGR
jgi:disulfide bond formation protein DsbB